MIHSMTALCAILLAPNAPAPSPAAIRGDYVEARTADVYTGPCFSNSEVFSSGNYAVAAWKVSEGSWNGVDLRGLSVAAALKGSTTFSEDQPELARAILIVDAQASPAQREALVAFAKAMGGARLNHLVDVRSSVINVTVERHGATAKGDASGHQHAMPTSHRASFWAPGLAEIVTRPLDDRDHLCGNETVAYPPLAQGVTVQPAYTLNHSFRGEGLGVRWDDPNCRSSFVGEFSFPANGAIALNASE